MSHTPAAGSSPAPAPPAADEAEEEEEVEVPPKKARAAWRTAGSRARTLSVFFLCFGVGLGGREGGEKRERGMMMRGGRRSWKKRENRAQGESSSSARQDRFARGGKPAPGTRKARRRSLPPPCCCGPRRAEGGSRRGGAPPRQLPAARPELQADKKAGGEAVARIKEGRRRKWDATSGRYWAQEQVCHALPLSFPRLSFLPGESVP